MFLLVHRYGATTIDCFITLLCLCFIYLFLVGAELHYCQPSLGQTGVKIQSIPFKLFKQQQLSRNQIEILHRSISINMSRIMQFSVENFTLKILLAETF